MGRRTLIEVNWVQRYLTKLPAAELRPYSLRIREAAAETTEVPATTRGTLFRLAATPSTRTGGPTLALQRTNLRTFVANSGR
jgi:hypothetical protein